MYKEYKLLNQFIDSLYLAIEDIKILKGECNNAKELSELESLHKLTLRTIKKIKTINTRSLDRGSLEIRNFLSHQQAWASPGAKPFVERYFRDYCEVDGQICQIQKLRQASPTPAPAASRPVPTPPPAKPLPYCRGKVNFPTELDAKIALAATQHKRRKTYYEEVRYYYCLTCSAWHLTSQGRRPARTRNPLLERVH